jgi:CubicO group peptidase (beta-lactamase class C family)
VTLAAFLRSEIEAGQFPGGAALVGTADRVLESAAAGHAALLPAEAPLKQETLFDLASLTKPLATGALFALSGLDPEDVPGRFFPAWKATRYAGVTLGSLLTHTSGLPAWYPLYARGEGAAAYRRTLASIELEAPAASAVIYSDLNFVLLGDILELHFASPLDRAFADLVAKPAESGVRYLPPDPDGTAATEKGDATERKMTADLGLDYPHFRVGIVRGEVHDGNAFRRGGVSGHAGLFGTASDVWMLARTWLDTPRAALAADLTPDLPEARGLAWQGRRGAGSASEGMSDRAFGHTGFTGTSVWVEPERGRIAVLLTNRVHPEVKPGNFHEVRRRFHALVFADGWNPGGS